MATGAADIQLIISVGQLTVVAVGVGSALIGALCVGFKYIIGQLKELKDEMRTTYKTAKSCEAEISAGRCLTRIATIMNSVETKLDSHYDQYRKKMDTQEELIEVLNKLKDSINK